MTSAQAKNLTLVTGGVLVAGTFLNHHYSTSTNAKKTALNEYGLGKPLVAIGILIIIMSFMADQVPDFAGPFALLVLIAYVSLHLDVFNEFAKGKQ